MSAFKNENMEALTKLEMAQVLGGKVRTESYPTAWEAGMSDTENWIYNGQVPVSGTVTYSDGSSHQMYP